MAKKKRFKYRKFLGFIYLAVSIALIYGLSVSVVRVYKENLAYKELVSKRDELLLEKQQLSKEVELLSDDDYVIRYARDNYIFSKEGEEVVKLPESIK